MTDAFYTSGIFCEGNSNSTDTCCTDVAISLLTNIKHYQIISRQMKRSIESVHLYYKSVRHELIKVGHHLTLRSWAHGKPPESLRYTQDITLQPIYHSSALLMG